MPFKKSLALPATRFPANMKQTADEPRAEQVLTKNFSEPSHSLACDLLDCVSIRFVSSPLPRRGRKERKFRKGNEKSSTSSRLSSRGIFTRCLYDLITRIDPNAQRRLGQCHETRVTIEVRETRWPVDGRRASRCEMRRDLLESLARAGRAPLTFVKPSTFCKARLSAPRAFH